jgi:inosine-uridine nucleoside N-ribohydrolase
MPVGEKLYVNTLGALTNVASALLMDESITDKIAVYWLGTQYHFEENYLTKTDFNCVMDIQAVDVLMQSDVEWHIFPVSVANKMTFDWAETKSKLEGQHEVCDFLLHRWYNHLDGGRKSRTIWDLTIIDAVIFPEKVEEVKIKTSKENGSREIYYYKSFDADFFRNEFFETTLKHVSNLE